MLSKTVIEAIERDNLIKLKILRLFGLFDVKNINAFDLACLNKSKKISDYLTQYIDREVCFSLGLIEPIKYFVQKTGKLIFHYAYLLFKNKHYNVLDCLLEEKLIDISDLERHKNNIINLDDSDSFKYLVSKNVFTVDSVLLIIVDEKRFEIIKCIAENKLFDLNKLLIEISYYEGMLEMVKYLVSIGADVNYKNHQALRVFCVLNKDIESIKYLGLKTNSFERIPQRYIELILELKFYKRWRLIHWKKWFRKVVTPLYYSPGFLGGEKEKILIEKEFN